MSSILINRSRFLARVFSAAGLLLFVAAFFAAPLAHAMMLCTMPCCIPGAGVVKIAAQSAQPCGSEECTISAPEATIPVAAAIAKSSSAAIINMDVAGVIAVAATHPAAGIRPDTSPHGVPAPIHLLNSTFRI